MLAQLIEAMRYKLEARVRFPLVSLKFFIDTIILAALFIQPVTEKGVKAAGAEG